MVLKKFKGKYEPPFENWEEVIKALVDNIGEPEDSPEDKLGHILEEYADRPKRMDYKEFDLFCKIFQIAWYLPWDPNHTIPYNIRRYPGTKNAADIINKCLREEGWNFLVVIQSSYIDETGEHLLYSEKHNNCWYRVKRI